jgi:DNA-binding transcriptional regulator YiaG
MTITLDELAEHVRTRKALPAPPERRAIREAAGVTLAQVAVVVGVTRSAVSFWELGESEPRGENLRRYSDVLRVLREAA